MKVFLGLQLMVDTLGYKGENDEKAHASELLQLLHTYLLFHILPSLLFVDLIQKSPNLHHHKHRHHSLSIYWSGVNLETDKFRQH